MSGVREGEWGKLMSRIDAPSNFRVVAAVREIARGGSMPLEGARLLGEALDAGIVPQVVFHEDLEEHDAVIARATAAGAEAIAVSRRVIEKLSDLPSTRGLVALAPVPAAELGAIRLAPEALAVLLDGVQNPLNVGAILRSAEAFGVHGVLLTTGSASPFSARTLRASAGSSFRVPLATGVSPAEALAWAREQGADLVGADAHGGQPPRAVASRRPLVLVIGSEGHGISDEIVEGLASRVTIPLAGQVESLNAGAAAAVLLYALSAGAE
ncbi:MAG: RNA methyltransferase [Thermoanaerobaculia bacterium]